MNLSKLVQDLKNERNRLDGAIAALQNLNGAGRQPRKRRGTISLAGRRRIAAAQRKRWAKFKKRNNRG